jgi:photosystem II stability/assembly factor-like uncharacterized protein
MANKLFSDLVAFSRGTGATRVNSAGLIVGVDFSVTSNTIATGSKTFTLAADLNVNRDWPVGSNVIAVAQAGATGSMTGTVTSYTPSTQSLVINVVSVTGSGTSTDWRIGSLEMREDYDPVTLVRKGVLSEVAATNVFGNSERAEWGAGNVGIQSATNNSILFSPTGSVRGILIVESAANTNHRLANNFTSVSGLVYTMSAWFKAKERVDAVINAGASQATFNLSGAGSVTSTSSNCQASISQFTDGWYLCSFTFTGNGVSFSTGFGIAIGVNNTYTGDGVSGLYVCGMSYVTANALTSYIPTTTAQVTRNADSFPLTATALTSIRQGESTLYAEIDCPDTGVSQKRALRLSGTNADIRIGKQGTGTLSNFTKMAEGAGLRVMSNSGVALISNNGLENNLTLSILARTGVAAQININGGISFSGTSFIGSQSSFDISFPSDLSTANIASVGSAGLNGAHWTGTSFIAVTSIPGIIIKSIDGISYRVINTPIITQGCTEVTSGLVGGTLRNVIVGDNGFIATSDDNGETWTSRTSGTAQNIRGVTFGAGSFVAAAANGTQSILTSPDGVTWTRQTTPNVSLVDVHFANSIYVAASNAGVVLTSTNGTTWIAATATNANQALNGVTYSTALNLWIVVGVAGTIITATDPAGTWTVQTSGTTQNLNEVTIFNNAIYIVGNTQTLLTSTNGTSYTSLSAGVTANLVGIAASPTTLLITGANGAMASSTDGTTFTSRTNNSATLNGIAFGNNTFVSVGNSANGSGYIATIGADGTVTRRVSGTTQILNAVESIANNFYAVGLNATILKSTDGGGTWQTRVIAGTAFSVNAISASPSLIIAVGTTGRYTLSSDNGETFAVPGLNNNLTGVTTQNLLGIAFANNIFVAVGAAGTIITFNGTTWTARTSGTTAQLNSVMFSTRDNLWYAAGNGGVLLYSPDAITWTAVQNSGTASILGTTLQSNQPLPQFKNGVNKIGISYKSNQVISALNGITSSTDITASIPSITAGNIGENLNGYIRKIDIYRTALTAAEMSAKTL